MKVAFSTVKGADRLATSPFYVGIVQHERTMTKRETYEYCADKTGYKPTAVKAVFLGVRDYVRENADRGNITQLDGIVSLRHFVRGAFEGLNGPWVKGKNCICIGAMELDPFKSILAGVIPVNRTEGANPKINTVYDEVTKEYDIITGKDVFSIAGADLGPDAEKDDEYVAFLDKDGGEVAKAEITYSDLQNVKAKLTETIPAGEYTLAVFTRSGMGEEYGVRKATRKVTVK